MTVDSPSGATAYVTRACHDPSVARRQLVSTPGHGPGASAGPVTQQWRGRAEEAGAAPGSWRSLSGIPGRVGGGGVDTPSSSLPPPTAPLLFGPVTKP